MIFIIENFPCQIIKYYSSGFILEDSRPTLRILKIV
jgi:hypothetical protein